MARYIDADALLDNLKKQYGEELGWQCTVNMSDVGMMIEDAPTIDAIMEYRKKVYCKMEKYSVFGREYIQRIMREVEKEMVGEKDV